jgi:serine/threonine protein kinase
MYSKSPLISQRSTLASLVSRVSQLGTSSTSGALGEKSSLSFPLFDFVQVASASGLKQYPPDIAEEGLVLASLGDGADYVVDKVRNTDGDIVVVKHVKATFAIGPAEPRGNEDSRIRKVLHEIKIATNPALKKSVNILQTKGFGWELGEESLTTPFVVVEYAEYGTLRDYLRKGSNPICIETKYELALDAAKGIQTLHAHHIAHGDLKLENALITSTPRNPTLKISDFGHSVVLEDDRKSYQYWGTEKYRPPEVTEQTGGSDTAGFIAGSQYRACDTYAYGLLVLELLIDGEQYFEGTVDLSQGEERFEPQQRLSTVDSESNTTISTLKHVAEECLLVEADGRPQMVEIVSQLGSVERLV